MAADLAGSPRPAAPMRLAVGAIFKNEGPYILEWIAHHRALGIERFFIADNDSTDETTAILAALARAGIIEHIPFPTVPGRPPQQAAYDMIVRRHQTDTDWIAFIDGDEFLVPAPPHRTLAEVLAALDPGPDIGAIVVNWALYGSSGQKQAEAGPVTARFTRRAEMNNTVNKPYKSVVRPAAVDGKVENPHYFPLRAGARTIHVDGSDVADAPGLPKGLSARTLWEPLRINHYIVKSWEEFHHRKVARGRATRTDKLRDESFFKGHDRNEVVDPMPPWLTAATKDEQRRIQTLLRSEAKGENRAAPSAWKSWLGGLLPQAPQGARGVVEAIEIGGDSAVIRGWALTPDRQAAAGFAVAVEERPVPVASLVKTQRSDVIARFPGASADCGFNLKIAWPPAAATGRARVPLTVTARYAPNQSFDLSSADATWLTASPPAAKAAPRPPLQIPDKPSMPPEATAALTAAFRAASCYLEYGSGGSTVLALDLGVPVIVSVESDRAWLQLVRQKLAARASLDSHHLLHVDVGPTKIHGYPASDAGWRQFHTYPLTPWDFCRTRALNPDLVLVDGRFRIACFLATVLFARPGCRILFDDFQDRPFYHSVKAFAEAGPVYGRMAEFAVREVVDRDAVWRALVAAVGDLR
jgi:hypothetical protein